MQSDTEEWQPSAKLSFAKEPSEQHCAEPSAQHLLSALAGSRDWPPNSAEAVQLLLMVSLLMLVLGYHLHTSEQSYKPSKSNSTHLKRCVSTDIGSYILHCSKLRALMLLCTAAHFPVHADYIRHLQVTPTVSPAGGLAQGM